MTRATGRVSLTRKKTSAAAHTAGRPYAREAIVTLNATLQPAISLIAGALILIKPKLLNFIVAIYLIIIGVSGLLHLNV